MVQIIELTDDLVFPTGTHIVTRREIQPPEAASYIPTGGVGMIIDTPLEGDNRYLIRFANSLEVRLKRKDFAIRKHARRAFLEELPYTFEELSDYVIYRCVVGSQALGLASDDSDTDRRGIYLAPDFLQWSLQGAPEQIENQATQETYWEFQKFLLMALKANPNVLECLYTPMIETASPLIEELLAMRSIFLSKLIYQTYNGYVLSQFKKLEQDLRIHGAPRWKHAMHLIRLLLSGITALKEGVIAVQVEEHREPLLSIKRGDMNWQALNVWRLQLHSAFDAAYEASHLPDYPDFEKANAFLIKARRSNVTR